MGCETASHLRGKAKHRKGLWSPEEDQRLRNYITKHGHGCWSSVPFKAGLERNGKSCRLRWINYLRPGLKRGTFSEEEEDTILALHHMLGNKWSQIAQHLPGRTDNEVKNFWHSYLKKKLEKQQEKQPQPPSSTSSYSTASITTNSADSSADSSSSITTLLQSNNNNIIVINNSLPKLFFAEWLTADHHTAAAGSVFDQISSSFHQEAVVVGNNSNYNLNNNNNNNNNGSCFSIMDYSHNNHNNNNNNAKFEDQISNNGFGNYASDLQQLLHFGNNNNAFMYI